MKGEPLRYDQWISEALLGVVARALKIAATEGLPGDHHFYITFRTDDPGVEMPDHLRAQHPEEMTIVLQHQYWDLVAEDDAFAVTLKFQGRSTRLAVPMAAVTAFADPSVNFGLQLKVTEEEAGEATGDATPADVIAGPAAAPSEPAGPEADDLEPAEAGADAEAAKKGEVIALDAFRKK